jgi:hypothetical protein
MGGLKPRLCSSLLLRLENSCCPDLSGFPDFVLRHIYEYAYVAKSLQLCVSLRFSASRYGFYCTIWVKKKAYVEYKIRCLRACAKITSHFRIPSSGHLCLRLNRKILEIPIGSGFLWICSIGATKSSLNLGTNSAKLFLRKPLVE